ncbi:MAG: HigA family addiction module antitoxin [Gammaproteobacteria bacterium]
MHNPPHPGESHTRSLPGTLGLGRKGSRHIRKTLSELLNGHAGVSPEMAIRLSIAFNTTPEIWFKHQMQYDL